MSRISIIRLALFVLPFITFSQKKTNIDSLINSYSSQSLDTLKVKTANSIVNYYMYKSITKAKQYAIEQLRLVEELEYVSGKATAHYQLGVVYNNLDKIDSAKYYYNNSLQIAKQLNNAIYISRVYRGLGILEFSQGNLNAADSINDLDLANAIKYKDTMGMALSYDFKGNIYQNKSYYSIALENVLKGFELFKILGDSVRLADSYNHLATIENSLKNYNKAIAYNEKALDIYIRFNDVYYEAQVLNDLGFMYKNIKQEDKALYYFNKSIEKSKIAKIKSIEIASLSNIGAIYNQLNRPDKAIEFLDKSIELSKSINSKRRIAISEIKIAEAYILLKDFNKAKTNALNALAYANSNDNISIKASAYKYLSLANESIGKNKEALKNYKTYKVLNDSIVNTEKIITIEELRVKFDIKSKESELALQEEEIKTLNTQAKNDKLTKTLYGIGMFSLLAIAGLLYFGFKQRINKNKIERKKQEAILKQEIEFKKKELASQTLHLVQKSTFIQELKENLERIKKSPKLFKVEFRRIVMLLKKESTEEKDWEVFKSYFSEVHNNFDEKIKSIAVDISEKEIRLASFLRMNLTTKEIASIINVLPDSVLKSKYRLKKKLGLEKNQDLTSFLNTL